MDEVDIELWRIFFFTGLIVEEISPDISLDDSSILSGSNTVELEAMYLL